MRDAKKISEELAEMYKAIKTLTEQADSLEKDADRLRDMAHDGGWGQSAMSDAGGFHYHVERLASQLESALSRAHSAWDYAEESQALRRVQVPA